MVGDRAALSMLKHADDTSRSQLPLSKEPQVVAFRTSAPPTAKAIWRLAALAMAVAALATATHAQTAKSPIGQPPTVPAGAPSAPEGGIVRAQHGDWQLVCRPPPPGAKAEICGLVQSVADEARNDVGLSVHVQKFSNGVRMLRVYAPTGVLLPLGLQLQIDKIDVGMVPFQRCRSFTCYAQIAMDDALLGKLSTAQQALFIVYQTEEQGIGIPISLKGFKDGVAALK